MRLIYDNLITLMWVAFLIYWQIMARGTKTTVRLEPARSGLIRTVLLLAAIWSRSVTVKQDHELITTGPYRLVRHPIYTGILIGFLGSAVALGEVRGLLALALAFWSLWRKLRLEETWMREQFGDSYADYSRRTAALVPGIL